MKFRHDMPFGAAAGREETRFRLWAPGASRVDVLVGGERGELAHPLAALADGWYEGAVAGAGAGARYRYRIDGGNAYPDPASRSNPEGVHAASEVIDPTAYTWQHPHWRGRPWQDAVLYEMHVGTFTPEGTFAAAATRLHHLADVGVTAIELMPVAAFAGNRNWGYDGVLPYAPAACYGTPDDLRRLVDAAHGLDLMVLLDVVYNHFGPDGNYLHAYAPQFFNPRHKTPWGDAINFDGPHNRAVRDFFIHNALYWLEEFRFDGLRLDAVHAIADDSTPDIVTELCRVVRDVAGNERAVHLVLENEHNEARRLVRDSMGRPTLATAQWNDDVHHALHVLLTGESDGYYADYTAHPLEDLGRCLAEGFAYQGDVSSYRGGASRGERSADLPPGAFVNFTQTHDQVGNRAFGERLIALADPRAMLAAVACILLAPSPPMLFMGEEFGATTPFQFFCDFGTDLAQAVRDGRRGEFARFARFQDPAAQAAIPDPCALSTFAASKLNWTQTYTPQGEMWLAFYRRCLALRRTHVQPLVPQAIAGASYEVIDGALLRMRWPFADGTCLHAIALFSPSPAADVRPLPARAFYESDPGIAGGGAWPAYAVAFGLARDA